MRVHTRSRTRQHPHVCADTFTHARTSIHTCVRTHVHTRACQPLQPHQSPRVPPLPSPYSDENPTRVVCVIVAPSHGGLQATPCPTPHHSARPRARRWVRRSNDTVTTCQPPHAGCSLRLSLHTEREARLPPFIPLVIRSRSPAPPGRLISCCSRSTWNPDSSPAVGPRRRTQTSTPCPRPFLDSVPSPGGASPLVLCPVPGGVPRCFCRDGQTGVYFVIPLLSYYAVCSVSSSGSACHSPRHPQEAAPSPLCTSLLFHTIAFFSFCVSNLFFLKPLSYTWTFR